MLHNYRYNQPSFHLDINYWIETQLHTQKPISFHLLRKGSHISGEQPHQTRVIQTVNVAGPQKHQQGHPKPKNPLVISIIFIQQQSSQARQHAKHIVHICKS